MTTTIQMTAKQRRHTKRLNENMQNYAEEQNMQNDYDDDDKPSCGMTPATQSTSQLERRSFCDEKKEKISGNAERSSP